MLIKRQLIFSLFLTCNTLLGREHCKSFGKYSYGDVQVRSWGEGTHYTVGNFCSIADGVTIFLGGNHRADWISTYPFPAFPDIFPKVKTIKDFAVTKGNVNIGNDVWIGSHVTILSGVTIGDGAILGAYSVIAKDVPAYAIVVGNPGKIIRYRFNDKIIKLLLTLQWWHWPIEKIQENAHLLCSKNIDEFINKHTQA